MSADTAEFKIIPLYELKESPLNPRHHYDPKALAELTESVKEKGILQPLLVRKNGTGYEIVAGSRRYRAALAAALIEVPCMVRALSDHDVLEAMVVENSQRADVHPLEEAEGYRALIELYQHAGEAKAIDIIAAKVAKSKSYVYQRLKLAELIDPAKQAFVKGHLTAGHAILLARLQPDDQKQAMEFCIPLPEDVAANRLISVRGLSEWIEENVHLELAQVPWDKTDQDLLPLAGSCTACPKRTGANPTLFDDISKKDICTDPGCFQAKRQAWIKAQQQAVKDEEGVAKVPALSSLQNWEFHGEKKHGVPVDNYKIVKKGACPHAAPGVMIDGKESGETKIVCLKNNGCAKHYPVTSHGRTDQDFQHQQKQMEEQRAKQERLRARWAHGRPAILKAVVDAVKKAATKSDGILGEVLVQALQRSRGLVKGPCPVPRGKTADDLIRHATFLVLIDHLDDYMAFESFPRVAKAFNMDCAKILKSLEDPTKTPAEIKKPAKAYKLKGKKKAA